MASALPERTGHESFFFFFFFFESAFVTRSMYVGTKTRAGAAAARLLGVLQS